jgi:hypothetical protein
LRLVGFTHRFPCRRPGSARCTVKATLATSNLPMVTDAPRRIVGASTDGPLAAALNVNGVIVGLPTLGLIWIAADAVAA